MPPPSPDRRVTGSAALSRGVRERARELGFTLVGITTPEPSGHMAFYRSWLARGLHGEMRYLARADAVARRGEVTRTLTSARSVVVVGHEYFQEDPEGVPADPSRGVVARYARGRDYHKVVKKKLVELGRWLEDAVGGGGRGDAERTGAGAESGTPTWRAYVDTGPLLERDLAKRAGLGWFGKNTMLIHPRKGSYFFLGVLLTDAELEADAPFEADYCGSCRACLDACPTGALLGRDENGAPVMDATRCISYLTIEHRGSIPEELRERMGNRVYGCDICQEVCPFSIKFSKPASEPSYAARGPGESPVGVESSSPPTAAWHPGTASPSLLDLFRTALDEESWESFSRGSAIRRAGREGFARNIAVALGNWGDPSSVPLLSQGLKDPHPLVRAHAAWALGRVGSAEALEVLRETLRSEVIASVRAEIAQALGE